MSVAVSTLLFTSAAKLIAALHYTLIRIADASNALPFDKLKLLTHDGYYGVLENELSERQRQCR